MRLTLPSALKQRGIMGMNMRNGHYIGRYNSRRLYPLVDDKLKTKEIALKAGITVPDLIAVINGNYQLKSLEQKLQGHQGVAMKPVKVPGARESSL